MAPGGAAVTASARLDVVAGGAAAIEGAWPAGCDGAALDVPMGDVAVGAGAAGDATGGVVAGVTAGTAGDLVSGSEGFAACSSAGRGGLDVGGLAWGGGGAMVGERGGSDTGESDAFLGGASSFRGTGG